MFCVDLLEVSKTTKHVGRSKKPVQEVHPTKPRTGSSSSKQLKQLQKRLDRHGAQIDELLSTMRNMQEALAFQGHLVKQVSKKTKAFSTVKTITREVRDKILVALRSLFALSEDKFVSAQKVGEVLTRHLTARCVRQAEFTWAFNYLRSLLSQLITKGKDAYKFVFADASPSSPLTDQQMRLLSDRASDTTRQVLPASSIAFLQKLVRFYNQGFKKKKTKHKKPTVLESFSVRSFFHLLFIPVWIFSFLYEEFLQTRIFFFLSFFLCGAEQKKKKKKTKPS